MNDEQRYYGKYRGTVVNPTTPETNGRLTATVTVGGTPMLVVAEACTPFAGASMGFYAMPQAQAGVWIEFEEGDLNRPIWTGCWWPEGQLALALGTGVDFTTLPLAMQSAAGNRLVIGTFSDDCITLETALADAGARVVISMDKLTLSFGPLVSIELSIDGVKICGEALTVVPV
jgi:hypothetical protein